MHTIILLPALALAALLAAPVAIGQHAAPEPVPTDADVVPATDIAGATQLMFTAVEPCRLLDTRQPSLRGGPLLAGSERGFLVHDANLAEEQGGAPGGCNLPADIRAVVINFTATRSVDSGFVTVWAHGAPRPATSSLNLIPGEDINNQISVAINTAGEPDLQVYSYAQTDLVADIVGYYAKPASRALECVVVSSNLTTVVSNGTLGLNSPVCPAGYTLTGGSCFAEGPGLQLVTFALGAQMPAPRAFCAYQNVSPQPGASRTDAHCCRVPGG